MSEPHLPIDFDWVTARSKCSMADMYEALRQIAQVQVQRRNALQKEGEFPDRFGFKETSHSRAFSVWDKAWHDRLAADFRVSGETLTVRVMKGDEFTATVTLNDRGECKFKVGNDELDHWQLLRRALEPLFFRTDEE